MTGEGSTPFTIKSVGNEEKEEEEEEEEEEEKGNNNNKMPIQLPSDNINRFNYF